MPTDMTPLALLEKLVAFDTTSAKTNLPCIEWIESVLAEHGIASERVPAPDGEPKASLFATLGEAGVPGIALSGHTDVVPVLGQAWTSDPFRLTERDGRLYGRGACDMKGYLACMLALVPELKRRTLATPIHLVFSYDEEVGCTGVRPLVAELGRRLVKPRIVLVGEPTRMTVVDAHKGANRYRTTVTGREAHSSMAHLGVNAIQFAGVVIAELQRLEDELRRTTRNDRFTPPWTTLQVGLIEGGRAQNIVPRTCWFSWEMRAIPGFDPEPVVERLRAFSDELVPRMRLVADDAGIETRHVNTVPAFASGEGSPAVTLALQLAGQNETFAVSYGTEAGLFQEAGPSSVICGPGDIAQAHTPDEWIEAAELDRCMAFLRRLADHAAAG